ncbi:Fis family transcriptional regulator [Alteromonas gilva]|uniref:Fis family transcriptional regulator n=1 Tax=Alteromonas gilva TaxID=2987522 RepID=A0ABT5KZT2_9ALTE|nr:Fis family transcriptional regulator [Alteromonas gilva]MDC8830275.1 Fis family transcriptional regulator [Alteromonas gilva]
MKKTDRKRDNVLRETLTEVCEAALERYPGFVWLTHFANYSEFPDSLSVWCIFDTEAQLASADTASLTALINHQLEHVGIKVKNIQKHVSFDTEEACRIAHGGNWKRRFSSQQH